MPSSPERTHILTNFKTNMIIIMFHEHCYPKAQSSLLNLSKRTIILFDSSSVQLFQSWTIRDNYNLSTEWIAWGNSNFQTIGTFYHFLMEVITIIISLAKKKWMVKLNFKDTNSQKHISPTFVSAKLCFLRRHVVCWLIRLHTSKSYIVQNIVTYNFGSQI